MKYDPYFAQVYNDLGTIYERQHHNDDALAAYQKRPRAAGGYGSQINLGQICWEWRRRRRRAVYLRKAVEIGEDAPVPCNNLATALLQEGQTDEAIGLLERALKQDPKYVNAYFNLGEALSRKGDLTGAATYYQRAIEMQGDFAAGVLRAGGGLFPATESGGRAGGVPTGTGSAA